MARLSLCLAALAAAAILCAPPRARAQAEPSGEPEADQQARALYLEGERHYAAGRYERAAELFQRAHELSGRPQLLFNLGNAYERMGAYRKAADALRRYVDSPEAEDRQAVRQRIERLEEAHRERAASLEQMAATRAEREGGGSAPEAAPVDTPAPQRRRTAYWWLGGGGAGIAAGIVLGLAARSAGSDVADQCPEEGGVRLCPTSAEGALSRERAFSIAADASVVLGVAAAGIGGYLLWSAREDGAPGAEREVAVSPAWVPGGIGVGVSGAF